MCRLMYHVIAWCRDRLAKVERTPERKGVVRPRSATSRPMATPMSESIPGWWFPGWLDAQIGLDLALRPSGDLLDRGIPCGRQVMVTTTAKEARYERSPFARRVQPVPSLDLRCPSR
jgi:hypothetical protein